MWVAKSPAPYIEKGILFIVPFSKVTFPSMKWVYLFTFYHILLIDLYFYTGITLLWLQYIYILEINTHPSYYNLVLFSGLFCYSRLFAFLYLFLVYLHLFDCVCVCVCVCVCAWLKLEHRTLCILSSALSWSPNLHMNFGISFSIKQEGVLVWWKLYLGEITS
jgi:hypothetical protein